MAGDRWTGQPKATVTEPTAESFSVIPDAYEPAYPALSSGEEENILRATLAAANVKAEQQIAEENERRERRSILTEITRLAGGLVESGFGKRPQDQSVKVAVHVPGTETVASPGAFAWYDTPVVCRVGRVATSPWTDMADGEIRLLRGLGSGPQDADRVTDDQGYYRVSIVTGPAETVKSLQLTALEKHAATDKAQQSRLEQLRNDYATTLEPGLVVVSSAGNGLSEAQRLASVPTDELRAILAALQQTYHEVGATLAASETDNTAGNIG